MERHSFRIVSDDSPGRPTLNSLFNFSHSLGTKLLSKLCLGLSHLRKEKFKIQNKSVPEVFLRKGVAESFAAIYEAKLQEKCDYPCQSVICNKKHLWRVVSARTISSLCSGSLGAESTSYYFPAKPKLQRSRYKSYE